MDTPRERDAAAPRRGVLPLLGRTLWKSWTDGIFGQSANAAFWQVLSLPPLLLGLLGSLGFVAGWFGPSTVEQVQDEILQLSSTVFTQDVVTQIIAPTVEDVLSRGRGAIVSVGFVLSLWAGSSALAALVDAITMAHDQHKVRNAIWQRVFALLLYLVSLVGAVFVLPLLAVGPDLLPRFFPEQIRPTVMEFVSVFYYPAMAVLLVLGLATLYKVVLPHKHPWHRGLPGALLAMAVFLVSTTILRAYITWVTSTGYTYGALATPIAFLLFSFFLAMAVVLGAQFNNQLLGVWPSGMTRRERRRWRMLEMDRRSAQARTAAERGSWQPGAARASSPADTTATTELPRNGTPDRAESAPTELPPTEPVPTEPVPTEPFAAPEHEERPAAPADRPPAAR